MKYYVCDFETSVYEGQTETEVWAAAAVEMNTEGVLIWNSIAGFFTWCEALTKHSVLYFHNGAFDFYLYYFCYCLITWQYRWGGVS